jgi:hypothetical protein
MIIEGLAYMAFSYLSCNPDKTYPATHGSVKDTSVLESFLRIADAWESDREALHGWLEATLTDDKYEASTGPSQGRSSTSPKCWLRVTH